MTVRYYPQEIMEIICKLTFDNVDDMTKTEITTCLEWLMSAAENKFNAKYFRTFYETLEELTDQHSDLFKE